MKTLVQHVAARLEDRAFCVVFENDLERCWPTIATPRTEREGQILGFAESHGWIAEIIESGFGMRAIFYSREHGDVGHEGSRARGHFWRSLKAPN
jgi:hypothetical protein